METVYKKPYLNSLKSFSLPSSIKYNSEYILNITFLMDLSLKGPYIEYEVSQQVVESIFLAFFSLPFTFL